jgi:hypothetical protein
VFLAGLEEGVFPSSRSIEEPGRLAEERRLAYVGITRAQRKLILSYAEVRRLHGQDNYGTPSRFLREIPAALLHEVRPKIQLSRPVYGGRVGERIEPATPGLKLGPRHPSELRSRRGDGRRGRRRARARAGQLRGCRSEVAGNGLREAASVRVERGAALNSVWTSILKQQLLNRPGVC